VPKLVRGSTILPNRTLPVISKPGQTIVAADPAGALFKSSNGGPYLPVGGGGGGLADPVSISQVAPFNAVVTSPAYVTLFTLPITTNLAASQLYYLLTASWNHSGAFAGNLAANFRFRLNGSLLPGGATDNRTRGPIGTVARQGRVAVTSATNPQTLDVEVTLIGAAANSFNIDPTVGGTLYHADLLIEEQPP
jgi:hypothetical protein